MNWLTSFNSIKNIAFIFLVFALVISAVFTVVITRSMYFKEIGQTKGFYNNLIEIYKLESAASKAHETYYNDINKPMKNPSELLLPLSAMITKTELMLSSTNDIEVKRSLYSIINSVKAIRIGYNNIREIKNDASNSDFVETIKVSIHDQISHIYGEIPVIRAATENTDMQQVRNELVLLLADFNSNLQEYYEEEPVEEKSLILLLQNIRSSASDLAVHSENKTYIDTVLKNIKLIIQNLPSIYDYLINNTNASYITEDMEMMDKLWSETMSAFTTLKVQETAKLKLMETEMESDWRSKMEYYIFAVVVGICFVIMIAVSFSKYMSSRLKKHLHAVESFTEGDRDVRIGSKHNDYLGMLANAFDKLADTIVQKEEEIQTHIHQLYYNNAALKQYKENLEQKVEERTKELSETAKQLQEEVEIRKEKEIELILFAKIFEYSSEAILITEKSGTITYVNAAFEKVTGYSYDYAVGKTPSLLHSDHQSKEYYSRMWHQIINHGEWTGEIWNRRKDGSVYPAFLSIYSISNEDGSVGNYVGIQRDITELKATQEQLRKKAFYDSLTGLPNRALCYDRLNVSINMARRDEERLAVMFLDLDKFKNINDTLGHDTGDILLKRVAERLIYCARESDTVCRLGGDEFVVILNNITDKKSVENVANRVIEQIAEPFEIAEHTIHTSTSVGITIFPDDGDNYETLMKNADIAMYKAKSARRGTYEFYTKEMQEHINEKMSVENKICDALKERSFLPFYQPIVDTLNNRVAGIEVLVRWLDGSNVKPPAEFLSVLEETGDIHTMTRHILEDSLMFLKKLELDGITGLWMSVNLSPTTLLEYKNFSSFIDLINQYNFKENTIVFEITENILINDFNKVQPILELIKCNNIKIALDDFGSGYSSLSYLSSLMPDKLKLDRSFVNKVTDTYEQQHICSSISNLAMNMGMELIAEGVETRHQISLLQDMGYRYMQGYYFARPGWEDTVTDYIFKLNIPAKAI